MASTVWKGHLTFGLISIPVRLYTAARGERVSFNQLHKECHSRLKQPLFCPTCQRQVERSEIVKGYEYEKDQYLLFTEEELEKTEPPSAKVMEILEFVKMDEVDRLHYDASYLLTPEDAGQRAYHLLTRAMEESGYAAIAKLTMHQREHIVIIGPRKNGLTLYTMYYTSEIREVAEYGQSEGVQLKDQEKKLALQLIESLAAPFEPQKYKDNFQENLKAMIKAKLEGQQIVAVNQPQLAPVIDLMEALKKSLSGKEELAKKPPSRAAASPPVVMEKRGKKAASR